MSEFTELNWKEALSSLFERSLRDADYRNLCLTDPRAAIAAVSDIELPPNLKFHFVDKREEFDYPILLPPAQGASVDRDTELRELIRWATLCTDLTTSI